MSDYMDIQRLYVIDGVTYRETGWLGCQLESLEWRPPAQSWPDRQRKIAGRSLTPFVVRREGLRWRISWCLVTIANVGTDRANELVKEFIAELRGK